MLFTYGLTYKVCKKKKKKLPVWPFLPQWRLAFCILASNVKHIGVYHHADLERSHQETAVAKSFCWICQYINYLYNHMRLIKSSVWYVVTAFNNLTKFRLWIKNYCERTMWRFIILTPCDFTIKATKLVWMRGYLIAMCGRKDFI